MDIKESVKPVHVRYKSKKTGYTIHHTYCGACGGLKQRVKIGSGYCSTCGTAIDWSGDEIIWKGL